MDRDGLDTLRDAEDCAERGELLRRVDAGLEPTFAPLSVWFAAQDYRTADGSGGASRRRMLVLSVRTTGAADLVISPS